MPRIQPVQRDTADPATEAVLGSVRKSIGTVLIGLMGCVVILGMMGAVDQKPATIEAREFVLRGQDGSVRASWTIRPDGTPGFGLFDRSGRVRLSIDLSPEGEAGLNLHDRSGTLRAAVALRPDGVRYFSW